MSLKYSILFLFALLVPYTSAGAWASGGNLCGYVNDEGQIHVGKLVDDACSDGNEPAEYIVMETTHLAFLKDDVDAYLTDDTKVEVIDSFSGPMMEAQADVEVTDETGSESTHAFVAQGAWVGDVDTGLSYGYVGTASYILQTGELNYKTNNFIIDDTVVEDVCIVEVDSEGNCVGEA